MWTRDYFLRNPSRWFVHFDLGITRGVLTLLGPIKSLEVLFLLEFVDQVPDKCAVIGCPVDLLAGLRPLDCFGAIEGSERM